jgi:hypothetical protein
METVGKNLVSAMPEKNFKGKGITSYGKVQVHASYKYCAC